MGGNTSLATATMVLANCMLISNTASSSGAALIVFQGGIADLVSLVFQVNVGEYADDGVGIVNVNGQVQCDVTVGCLLVCTVCQAEEVPSLPPARPPTVRGMTIVFSLVKWPFSLVTFLVYDCHIPSLWLSHS